MSVLGHCKREQDGPIWQRDAAMAPDGNVLALARCHAGGVHRLSQKKSKVDLALGRKSR